MMSNPSGLEKTIWLAGITCISYSSVSVCIVTNAGLRWENFAYQWCGPTCVTLR